MKNILLISSIVLISFSANAQVGVTMDISPSQCYGYVEEAYKTLSPSDLSFWQNKKQSFINAHKKMYPKQDFNSGVFMGEMNFKMFQQAGAKEIEKDTLKKCFALSKQIN
jgi:hypothetical protein